MEKWLEVDLDKLGFNVRSLKSFFKVPIMAVMKHDGYGLGGAAIAGFLEKQGIDYFAVTNIGEGAALRKNGIVSPILVFAPFVVRGDDVEDLWRYKLTPAVYSLEVAEELNDRALISGEPINVHIKVDSGMGRMGFSPRELKSAAQELKKLTGLRYEGIFTHYSNAFESKMDYTKRQLDSFVDAVACLEATGFEFKLKYSANSLAALKFPETHMDMVAVGSAFLGNSTINPDVPLEKIYRGRARVLQVRKITAGSFIGYSNTFVAKKDLTTAVIPIGYADGFGVQKMIDSFRIMDFLRELFNLLKSFLRPPSGVYFEGRPLRILGKTSLQLSVVDTGGLPLKPGDVVDVDLNPLLANARVTRVYTGRSVADAATPEHLEESGAATAESS